jgi:hypothetical protein
MGLRTTLVLLVAVAGLGAALLLTDRTPPVEVVAKTPALEGRSMRQASRIRWQMPNLPPIELAARDDGFVWMVEPIVDRASAAYVRQIVTTWDQLELEATPYADDEASRAKAGLDPSSMTLSVTFRDGVTMDFDVGGPGPFGTDRFVRRAGKIWRGSEGLYESFLVGVQDLRERAVFQHTEPLATELRVEQQLPSGKRETLHLSRDGEGAAWRLRAPIAGRADPAAAITFITSVLSLRIDEFPSGMVRPKEGEPDYVIDVRGAHGAESLRLYLDPGSEALYGFHPERGVWFVTDNRQYTSIFLNAASALRARMLVSFGSTATELVEVLVDPGQGRGDRVRLARATETDEWRLVEPVSFPTHATPVQELAQAINNLVAAEFVAGANASDPALGLGPGRLLLAVRGSEQKALTSVWFGADAPQSGWTGVYACRADDPASVALVRSEPVALLRRPWTVYCARQVLRIAPPVERLELARGEARRLFERRDGRWVREGQDGARDDVAELADELRELRAAAAVDLRGAGSFGDADWTLVLASRAGDPYATLRVWDRGADRPLVVQSHAPGQAAVDVGFELGARDSKDLRALWQ